MNARTKSFTIAAPGGGINTVDAASGMAATDCLYAYNLIAAEFGLRVRLGYQEWCTGLSGAARTIIPFNGGASAQDRLFVASPAGIYDCTNASAAPTLLIAFGITTGNAGFGVSTAYTTPGGRFLVYCDEANGAYVWTTGGGGSWSKVVSGTTLQWLPNTAYVSTPTQNFVLNNARIYKCMTGGVSAASGGPTGTGLGIVDGTVTWDYVSPVAAGAIGPSLNDQNLGLTANPANFTFVTVWKSRLWFTEKDSSRGWYLPVGQLYGTAQSFDFGVKMQAGGELRGLYNWSYDAGGGLDTLLVGLSAGGDVVIYKGTDPNSSTTFGLQGTWSVGGVPAGRRIAIDFGGELLVASSLGIVPLSKLVTGQPVVAGDRSIYATGKITNLFAQLATANRGELGWALVIHPTDNALLVLTPVGPGQPTTQLAMSFATRGWFQYRDLPMVCAGRWNGQLYFGTLDGRVCVNTGYVDDVKLADTNLFTPVSWSLLTAYSNLGNTKSKRLQQVRSTLQSQSQAANVQVTAKYDYNTDEPAPPAAAAGNPSGNVWNAGVWDAATWAGDYTNVLVLQGVTGVGRSVALAVRGITQSRTIITQFDVYFDAAEGDR